MDCKSQGPQILTLLWGCIGVRIHKSVFEVCKHSGRKCFATSPDIQQFEKSLLQIIRPEDNIDKRSVTMMLARR